MSSTQTTPETAVAVIGLAGSFPGAPRVDLLWRALLSGQDAITAVPSHRWPSRYFDPTSTDPARFYARRGGFIDESARFEALRFGVMPRAVSGAEPDQLMTLQICAEALDDAGYAPRPQEEGVSRRAFERSRAQVLIGRGGYIGPAMNSLNIRVRTLQQLDLILASRGWGSEAERDEVRRELADQLRPFGPDTAIGLVPNLCASRVADRLSLGGAAYTIDAACASSLIAVERGCASLMSGEASLVIAGGVHLVHDLTFWAVFSQLGALSRAQKIRPFDADADGLLIGEGVGAVVLKRLDEALRDGDRIYSVIRGAGSSSDAGGASLLSPDSAGQARAIRDAWADLDPRQIGLLEAHGTATPTGDLAELTSTINALGGAGERVGVGSIKSNIGHTMPAAGIAGLIKASLSIYHGVKPPTLHVNTPHPLFRDTRFEPQLKAESWEGDERWAGVSAFGFGGINAHLALSRAPHYAPLPPKIARLAEPSIIIGVAGESAESLARHLEALADAPEDVRNRAGVIGEGAYRAALIDPSPHQLREAAKLARQGSARRGRRGLWLSGAEVTRPAYGSLALMFPGVEASFAPKIDDLCARHGIPTPELFSPDDLGARGVSVVRLGIALYTCFERLGLSADYMLGHSIGEWTASICAGYLERDEIEPFISSLDPDRLKVPEVAFLAVGASAERVRELLTERLETAPAQHETLSGEGHPEHLSSLGVYCSHDNCPHQSIYCLPPELTTWALDTLAQAQIIAQELPFRSGFHAPHFKPFAAAFTQHLRALSLREPHTPLWSATTASLYPVEAEPFYDLSERHLTESVRFRALTERLYDEGVRVFVQLGIGSLSSFIGDTLRGRPHRVIDAYSERRSGWAQWLNLAATLFIEGYDVRLDHLNPPGVRGERAISLDLGSSLLELKAQPVQDQPPEDDPSQDHLSQAQTQAVTSSGTPQDLAERPSIVITEERPLDVGAQRGPATYPSPLKLLASRGLRGEPEWGATWEITTENAPHLRDHCFFRQPHDWPELSDRFPVVPMTLSVQWVMEIAQQLAQQRDAERGGVSRVVEVSEVRASKWIEAEPPQSLEVRARWRDADELEVNLRGHLSARVRVASRPPSAPSITWSSLAGEQRASLSAADIYRDRWMFHGPAYQGIDELTGIAPRGIRGVIRNDGTPGALLDNVGQLFGLWVMLTQAVDRVVMPVRLERVSFYGPPPARGERLPCAVVIEEVSRREVKARMALWCRGRVWATFEGWRDWRFETSGALWGLMRYPERNLYSSPLIRSSLLTLTLSEGISAVASSREFLVGRCLNHRERAEYRSLSLKRQRGWLAGRVAAKDAGRAALWSQSPREIYPIELALCPATPNTPPRFDLERSRPLAGQSPRLSIAHREGVGVAAVSPPHAPLLALGVDLELVIDRQASEEAWRSASFKSTERDWVEQLSPERQRDAYATLWAMKEASAKAATGLALVEGLGSPKRWEVKCWRPDQEEEGLNSASRSDLSSLELRLSTLKIDIPSIASGSATIMVPDGRSEPNERLNHQSSEQTAAPHHLLSRWWIFERAERRWVLAIAYSIS